MSLFELTLVRISTGEVLLSLTDCALQECDILNGDLLPTVYLQRNDDASTGLQVRQRRAAILADRRITVVFNPRDELFPAEAQNEEGDFRVWCRARG